MLYKILIVINIHINVNIWIDMLCPLSELSFDTINII